MTNEQRKIRRKKRILEYAEGSGNIRANADAATAILGAV